MSAMNRLRRAVKLMALDYDSEALARTAAETAASHKTNAGSCPQEGDDPLVHLAFADHLSDNGDERAAIVRGHMADRDVFPGGRFPWHNSPWIAANASGRRILLPEDGKNNHMKFKDGSHVLISLQFRRRNGGIEVSPELAWRIPGSALIYQAIIPRHQASRILRDHISDDDRERAERAMWHFSDEPEAKRRLIELLASPNGGHSGRTFIEPSLPYDYPPELIRPFVTDRIHMQNDDQPIRLSEATPSDVGGLMDAAYASNPRDAAPRLVLADALTETGHTAAADVIRRSTGHTKTKRDLVNPFFTSFGFGRLHLTSGNLRAALYAASSDKPPEDQAGIRPVSRAGRYGFTRWRGLGIQLLGASGDDHWQTLAVHHTHDPELIQRLLTEFGPPTWGEIRRYRGMLNWLTPVLGDTSEFAPNLYGRQPEPEKLSMAGRLRRAVRMSREVIDGLTDRLQENIHDPNSWRLLSDALRDRGLDNFADVAMIAADGHPWPADQFGYQLPGRVGIHPDLPPHEILRPENLAGRGGIVGMLSPQLGVFMRQTWPRSDMPHMVDVVFSRQHRSFPYFAHVWLPGHMAEPLVRELYVEDKAAKINFIGDSRPGTPAHILQSLKMDRDGQPVRFAATPELIRDAARRRVPYAHDALSLDLHAGHQMPVISDLLTRAPHPAPEGRTFGSLRVRGGGHMPLHLGIDMHGGGQFRVLLGSDHGGLGSWMVDHHTARQVWEEFKPHVRVVPHRQAGTPDMVAYAGEDDHQTLLKQLGADDAGPPVRAVIQHPIPGQMPISQDDIATNPGIMQIYQPRFPTGWRMNMKDRLRQAIKMARTPILDEKIYDPWLRGVIKKNLEAKFGMIPDRKGYQAVIEKPLTRWAVTKAGTIEKAQNFLHDIADPSHPLWTHYDPVKHPDFAQRFFGYMSASKYGGRDEYTTGKLVNQTTIESGMPEDVNVIDGGGLARSSDLPRREVKKTGWEKKNEYMWQDTDRHPDIVMRHIERHPGIMPDAVRQKSKLPAELFHPAVQKLIQDGKIVETRKPTKGYFQTQYWPTGHPDIPTDLPKTAMDKAIEHLKAGKSLSETGRILGRTKQAIRQAMIAAKKRGLLEPGFEPTRGVGGNPARVSLEIIAQHVNNKLTSDEIAAKTGMSPTWVTKLITQARKAGLIETTKTGGLKPGSLNSQILDKFREVGDHNQVAREFGIKPSRVKLLIAREKAAGRMSMDGEPIRMAAQHDRPVSIAGAAGRVDSLGHVELTKVLAGALSKSGLSPHRVYAAIHDYAGQARASAVAAVFGEQHPQAADYGAAWQGLLAKTPSLVVFRSQDDGADSVYRFGFKGPQHAMSKLLDGIGVTNRVFVPHGPGTHVFLYDQGRKLRDSVGQLVARLGLTAVEHVGMGHPIGGGDDMGRAEYRNEIRSAEQMGRDGRPVRLSSPEDHKAMTRAISANPFDNAHRMIYADMMEESGYPETARAIREARLLEGFTHNANEVYGEPEPGPNAWDNVFHILKRHPANDDVRIAVMSWKRRMTSSHGHDVFIEFPGWVNTAYSTADNAHIDGLIREISSSHERMSRDGSPVRLAIDPAFVAGVAASPEDDLLPWLGFADHLAENGLPALGHAMSVGRHISTWPQNEYERSLVNEHVTYGSYLYGDIHGYTHGCKPLLQILIRHHPEHATALVNLRAYGNGHEDADRNENSFMISDPKILHAVAGELENHFSNRFATDYSPKHARSARMMTDMRESLEAAGHTSGDLRFGRDGRPIKMAIDRDFLRALTEAPEGDDAPWLVFADHLEENGFSGLAHAMRISEPNALKDFESPLHDQSDPHLGTWLIMSGGDKPGMYLHIQHNPQSGRTHIILNPDNIVTSNKYDSGDQRFRHVLFSDPSLTHKIATEIADYHKMNGDVFGSQARAFKDRLEGLGIRSDHLRFARNEPLTKSGPWQSVSSSWISALREEPGNSITMRVKKGKKKYTYEGVAYGTFKRWLKAASKGKNWWRNIRQYGPATKSSRVDSRKPIGYHGTGKQRLRRAIKMSLDKYAPLAEWEKGPAYHTEMSGPTWRGGWRVRDISDSTLHNEAIEAGIRSSLTGKPFAYAWHGGSVAGNYGYRADTAGAVVVALPSGHVVARRSQALLRAQAVTATGVAARLWPTLAPYFHGRASEVNRQASLATAVEEAKIAADAGQHLLTVHLNEHVRHPEFQSLYTAYLDNQRDQNRLMLLKDWLMDHEVNGADKMDIGFGLVGALQRSITERKAETPQVI